MLHNHHSKSKGLKHLAQLFTTKHARRAIVTIERRIHAEKKKEGEQLPPSPFSISNEVLVCFLTNESRDIKVVSACAHHRPR